MSQNIMMERAELFYRVVDGAGLFREPMSLDEFKVAVSEVVEQYAQRVDNRKSSREGAFMVGLPIALKAHLREQLKLGEDELLQSLRTRALAFHQALIEANAYQTGVSESLFLEHAKPTIERSAKEALGTDGGILDLILLHMASSIVGRLSEKVLYYSWDYEFGYKDYFEGLERVLGQINIPLKWDLVKDGEMKRVEFQIGDRAWVTNVSDTGFAHVNSEDFLFYHLAEIKAHFETLGWQNFDLPAVDQVAESILVPLENAHVLEEWLLSKPTDLLRIFYGVRYWPRK